MTIAPPWRADGASYVTGIRSSSLRVRLPAHRCAGDVRDGWLATVSGKGGTYRAVMVTTTEGRRIRLAALTSGIVTPEEFMASAKQIQDYWRAAPAATGPPERTVSGGGARSRDRSAGPAMAATARRSPARGLLTRAAIAAAVTAAHSKRSALTVVLPGPGGVSRGGGGLARR